MQVPFALPIGFNVIIIIVFIVLREAHYEGRVERERETEGGQVSSPDY